jgi:hypothetical protein
MSRNQNPKNHSFGLTDMGSNPYFGQHIGWAVVAWCVVAGLIALTWVDQNSAGWWVVGLGVLSALLAVALERALTFTGLGSGFLVERRAPGCGCDHCLGRKCSA